MAKAAPERNPDAPITLKITLRGSKPPIWRRIVVPASMTLADLHDAIQAVMDWHDSHMHVFDVGGRAYGDPDSLEDAASQSRLTVKGIKRLGIKRFTYTYDFGDDWEHVIDIEDKPAAEGPVPRCTGGKRAAPPEDCGGIWGYQELLAVLADPEHPDHEEQSEWYGADRDPNAFDLDAVNIALTARFG